MKKASFLMSKSFIPLERRFELRQCLWDRGLDATNLLESADEMLGLKSELIMFQRINALFCPF